MKKAASRVFKNKQINWYTFTIKLIIFFNFIGIIVLTLGKNEITVIKIFLYTMVAVIFSLIIYLNHINRVEYVNDELIISYNYKSYKKLLKSFIVREKQRRRGINIKYQQIIIENNELRKKFKIDSNEWADYKEIKEFFLEKKLLENKNEQISL